MEPNERPGKFEVEITRSERKRDHPNITEKDMIDSQNTAFTMGAGMILVVVGFVFLLVLVIGLLATR